MDDDEIVGFRQARRVLLGMGNIGVLFFQSEIVCTPLQGVVDGLRHLKERLIAADYLPIGHYAKIIEEWHHGAQKLGHAASIGRRIHM